MLIKKTLQYYLGKGMNIVEARAHAASDLFLYYTSQSKFKSSVTLKGGVLIYNLTGNARRMTRDLDIDFIHYPMNEKSIDNFLDEISRNKESVVFRRISELEKLSHDDYHGIWFKVRVTKGSEKLELDVDVGIHTYSVMEQKEIILGSSIDGKGKIVLTNSPEQIVIEKMLATYRLGLGSGRYRDIDDIYYFIRSKKINPKIFKNYLEVVLKVKNITQDELIDRLEDVYKDRDFIKNYGDSIKKWSNVDIKVMSDAIISFLDSI
ncbi:MAG: nucleotidyl transferase AbiEii/AbiGii toxin family protein [Bacilli bacterium]|nr:nucleotidyl transferase AbiEii/AbiGii toxin family protein [Bacilli bacterium]